ncbi:DNA polymerase II large subunit [Candidatus Woesearchaeota archaeon]|nr:DNA polymerase II large subunit [Candidatus Woesearchaeota archaeon]
MQASQQVQQYFDKLNDELRRSYEFAQEARSKGYDPEDKVNIPLAKDIAERVEGLISAVCQQILGSGVAQRIRQLEEKFGSLDWRVAMIVAEEVAKQKYFKASSQKEAIEVGIRVGLAYITLGVIAAPLEGFIELREKSRRDGKKYLSLFFAGPIRAAGGTAGAVSVIIADYVRKRMGYERYDPEEPEIKRSVMEILDYHERITNLQYFPSEKEVEFIVRNLGVEINGDPTEELEVSNYKDLPRIETNRLRGGMCLVLAEGIAQKSPKLWKRLKEWGKEYGLEWDFLEGFLELQKTMKAKGVVREKQEKGITPNYTYIKDLVAGRPVLSYPLQKGGFRLRYGRSRTSGFAADCLHPATMVLLNNYIATGTQLKVERPGKATVISPCDTIEGPIIRLDNGSVVLVESESQARQLRDQVSEIIFLGDILVNYGDFSENNHVLVPAGYCEEWHIREMERATVNMFGSLDIEKLAEYLDMNHGTLTSIMKNTKHRIDFNTAHHISSKLGVPLHPRFTYHWKELKKEDLAELISWLDHGRTEIQNNQIEKIILQKSESKRHLEKIGIPHMLVNNEFIVIEKDDAKALLHSLGFTRGKPGAATDETSEDVLSTINKISKMKIMDKSGTFIGSRMGRPEKAKMRKLKGSPHVLFPVGEEGGRMRSFQAAMAAGRITADFPIFLCEKCEKETIFSVCEDCGAKTKKKHLCNVCGPQDEKQCKKHGDNTSHVTKSIDIKAYFDKFLKQIKTKNYPDMIKGVKGTSNRDHVPEHPIKGILRAENRIYVNKDGTTRYDMIEMPITHFKPREIRAPIEKLKQLGYTRDINGKELTDKNQIIELLPQDIILPSCDTSPDDKADDTLLNVCNYIDDLLEKLYRLPRFYNLNSKHDLIGHLIVGLAPHTSAGILGRIIGFSNTQGMFCHPMMHAAMRRNCDGDEACVMMLMDSLLNFSRSFLPDKRGSRTMDAPLVLTSTLIPSEIDDEVHGMDVAYEYPLELYHAALEYKYPWEVKIDQIKHRLGTEKQYEKMGFTHDTTDFNLGVRVSSYKTIPTMEDKMKGQMELAEKIRAVNVGDVARLVIEKHFLKDIKGNLRKFSTQKFRCGKCNEKFRRPPLSGKCTNCGGDIIFTISEGSIIKYLEPSLSLASKYNVPIYLKQTLDLLQRRVDGVFGKEKEKQQGLGRWFG